MKLKILVLFIVICGSAGAQIQSDTSDFYWKVVKPRPSAMDVDMKQCLTGSVKDSVVRGFAGNPGSWKYRVDEIYFRGADAPAFALVSGLPKYTVEPGLSKDAEFRFIPLRVGLHTAEIVIVTQADTLIRKISGEGVLPQLEIVNRIVDFGQVELGAEKDTLQAATIRNISSLPVTITETKHNLPNISDFSTLAGGGSFTLQPNETARLDLRFKPAYAGRTTGTLEFYYDGVGSPAVVILYGEGINKQPALEASSVVLKDLICESVSTGVLELYNGGGSPLIISEISMAGANPNEFTINAAFPIVIEPDSLLTMNISFIPLLAGQKSAGMVIKSNAVPDSIVTIPLTAKKDSINLAFDVQTVDLGVIKLNQTKDTTINIENFGSLFDSGNITNTGVFDIDKKRIMLSPGTKDIINIHFDGSATPVNIDEIIYLTDSICNRVSACKILLGVISQPVVTLMTPDMEAYPGEIIDIPVILKSEQNLAASQIKEFEVNLNFNSTLLAPLDYPVQVSGINSGFITLADLPADVVAGATLTTVKFKAGLGNTTECKLLLTDAKAVGGSAQIELESGAFKLLGVCPDGGNRLINPSGKTQILSITPNPSNDFIDIEMSLNETGDINLYLSDILGNAKESLFKGNNSYYGIKKYKFDISKLSSGIYFVILKTPTILESQMLMINN